MSLLSYNPVLSRLRHAPTKRLERGGRIDGKFFGSYKSVAMSNFKLKKWAEKIGYSENDLEDLDKKGVLRSMIRAGPAGAGYVWHDPRTGWTRCKSKRTGVLAVKVGMKQEKDWWGTAHPVTVLQLQDNVVIQVKSEENDGYTSLQIGSGIGRLQKTTRAMQGHFAKHSVPPKQFLREFRVTPDAVLNPGTLIPAEHFKPGQFVDVRAKSKGKGFQGVMKRWGFGGQPATHGVSISHRSHGSTGQNQDPGRVFKGKKMAGHMGNKNVTVHNLRVIKIDTENQMLYVIGAVPGPKGGLIEVSDAIFKPHARPPPFPTFIRHEKANIPRFLYWRFADPFKKVREVDWEIKSLEALAALKAAQASGESDVDDSATSGIKL